jgi:hypothetical protein
MCLMLLTLTRLKLLLATQKVQMHMTLACSLVNLIIHLLFSVVHAINSAIEVDITGQVVADSIGVTSAPFCFRLSILIVGINNCVAMM